MGKRAKIILIALVAAIAGAAIYVGMTRYIGDKGDLAFGEFLDSLPSVESHQYDNLEYSLISNTFTAKNVVLTIAEPLGGEVTIATVKAGGISGDAERISFSSLLFEGGRGRVGENFKIAFDSLSLDDADLKPFVLPDSLMPAAGQDGTPMPLQPNDLQAFFKQYEAMSRGLELQEFDRFEIKGIEVSFPMPDALIPVPATPGGAVAAEGSEEQDPNNAGSSEEPAMAAVQTVDVTYSLGSVAFDSFKNGQLKSAEVSDYGFIVKDAAYDLSVSVDHGVARDVDFAAMNDFYFGPDDGEEPAENPVKVMGYEEISGMRFQLSDITQITLDSLVLRDFTVVPGKTTFAALMDLAADMPEQDEDPEQLWSMMEEMFALYTSFGLNAFEATGFVLTMEGQGEMGIERFGISNWDRGVVDQFYFDMMTMEMWGESDFHVGRFELNGLDYAGIFKTMSEYAVAMEADMPMTSMAVLKYFDSIRFADFELNAVDSGTTAFDEVYFGDLTMEGAIPTSMMARVINLRLDKESLDDPELQAYFTLAGVDDIVSSYAFGYDWDLEAGTIETREFRFGFEGLWQVSMALEMSNVGRPGPRPLENPAWLMTAAVADLDLEITEAKLVDIIIERSAAQIDVSPAEYRESLIAALNAESAELAGSESLAGFRDAIAAFIRDPQSLRLVMTAEEPINLLAAMAVSQQSPLRVLELMKPEIEVNGKVYKTATKTEGP